MTWQNYKNFNYRFSTLLMIKSNSAEFRGKSRRNGKNIGFDSNSAVITLVYVENSRFQDIRFFGHIPAKKNGSKSGPNGGVF